ncbi:MAG: polyprenyl synthetase family protein, partial [Saprospiraceae bacterium]|nr:polyprenyl synthetase family protein [Saprospiraceae bacterium]
TMESKTLLLDRITRYMLKTKGKQMRPIFVFLSAKLCGQISESTYTAAAMMELLHTASLVHDDVVDDSIKRRGFWSINALWKSKIAVLVGDFLLSRGLLIAVKNKEYVLLEILSEAVEEMAEGELLQIEKARRLDIKEDIYYKIIKNKSASLISAACKSGASSVGGSTEEVQKLSLLGESIGMAFQIRDDLFDYGAEDVGKPLGIDIKEKKMTLPLIYSLQKCTPKERRRIIYLIKRKNTKASAIKEVIEFVNNSGGIEYARKVMQGFRDEAVKILHEFPLSPARESMEQLIAYVTDRKK